MNTKAELRERLAAAGEQLHLDADGNQNLTDRGMQYLSLLQKWNRYGLVAPGNPSEWLSAHLLDCLALVPAVQAAAEHSTTSSPARLLDVGTGAGLPGLILALALPQLSVCLLDSRRRPCTFVHQAAVEMGLDNVSVHCGRVEELPADLRSPLLTARALAPPSRLLPLLACAAATGASALLPIGPEQARFFTAKKPPPLPAGWSNPHCQRLRVPRMKTQRFLLTVEYQSALLSRPEGGDLRA